METMRIFSPATLAGMTLRNRFVRSATFEGMADDDGLSTDELLGTLRSLAEGEVGLIISGHAYVTPVGQAGAHQLAIDRDACTAGIAALADAVHQAGGRLAIQLAHAGGAAAVEEPVGPSPFTSLRSGRSCRAMTAAEIAATPEAFAAAAARARSAGCDGVQIHAAHGYMLSQFLSPEFNRREDRYGGSLENRARLLLEIVDAVRERVGRDFPLLVKINSQDFLPVGLSEDEALTVMTWLEAHGVDAIEVSGGVLTSQDNLGPSRKGDLKPEGEAYFRGTAARLKQKVSIPVILVGGVRTAETAEALVVGGTADFLSMSRPLIREPGLIRRWREGDRRRATCISCNLCFVPVLKRSRVYCLAEERQRRRETR